MEYLQKEQRNYLFDNIKVVLIVSVVMAHFFRVSGYFPTGSLSKAIYTIIFIYLMQGFFFVSGYFSHNVDKCQKTAFKTFIVPYIVFMILYYFTRVLVFGHATLSFLEPTHGMWYLLAMFVYRFLIKYLEKIPHFLWISLGLYFAASVIPPLNETLALGRIFSFLFFFMLGFYCTPERIAKIKDLSAAFGVTLGIVVVTISMYLVSAGADIDFLLLKYSFVDYGVTPLYALAARAVMLVLSLSAILVIIALTPEKHNLFTNIGQNTITVYLGHIFIRYIIKGTGIYGHGNLIYYLIVFGLTFITVFVFSRPFMTRAYNAMINGIYDLFIEAPKRMIRGEKKQK